MGGQAFNAKALNMPRMPPALYYALVPKIQAQLCTLYALAETPIEGPGKVDHGDVDVIVLPKGVEHNDGDGCKEVVPTIEDVAKVLGATHWHTTPNSATNHFAILWPGDESSTVNQIQSEGESQIQPRYIQIDVFLCTTLASIKYNLFHKAHSDMWVILGAFLRRCGFLSTPSGFWIRIIELEGWNKNLARIKLSDDPVVILRYLGLDESQYWSRFKNFTECMDYIATCRFHDPARGKEYDGVGVEDNKELIAHDRSKSHKRPMFRYWLEEYLPAHREDKPGTASRLRRDEVVEDVRAFFGEEIMKQFDERRETEVKKMNVAKLFSDLRKSLPCEGSDLTYTMKGLRHEVLVDGDDCGGDGTDMTDVQQAFMQERFDDVKEWAEKNWEEVMGRQRVRDQEKSSQKLSYHLDKLKLDEPEVRDGGSGSTG